MAGCASWLTRWSQMPAEEMRWMRRTSECSSFGGWYSIWRSNTHISQT